MLKNEFPPSPTDPTDVDTEWLSIQLRKAGLSGAAQIGQIVAEPLGESVGFLSRVARLIPEYVGERGDYPSSLILKLETDVPNFRSVADRLRAFDREIAFYREMAGNVPTRLPIFYSGHSEGGGGWLLMEDLSHLSGGDQIHGLSNAQVEMALQHMAAVHATHWENPQLPHHNWLPDHDFWFRTDVSGIWPAFREHYELRIGQAAAELIRRVLDRIDELDEMISRRPLTLVHGDLRADNLLLGKPDTQDEVLILDWQTVTRSLGAIDVAMLIGGSDPPAERAGHYQDLFESWHAALTRGGVTNYSSQEALDDLRLSLLSCLRIPLKVFNDLDGPDFRNAREAQLANVFILRHSSAAVEFEADRVLP